MQNPPRLGEVQVRLALFEYLDILKRASPTGALRSSDINEFRFRDHRIPLILQTGIRKPAGLDAALAITTTYSRPNHLPPYEDSVGDDGLLRYKYRGRDPEHSDNRALRTAMLLRLPLAYFIGVGPGAYYATYPVWLVNEEPENLQFSVSTTEGSPAEWEGQQVAEEERTYAWRLLRERIQQPVFRATVLTAYEEACAMCHLRHAELLDAAHIVPGRQSIVPNGLALCKIHHAAFDLNILGVRPNLKIEVRDDIRREQDGPMLRHGFQGLDGEKIQVPRQRIAHPHPDLLEVRYEQFRAST